MDGGRERLNIEDRRRQDQVSGLENYNVHSQL